MVEKVNEVANYLKQKGLVLKGVKSDGNCFPLSFLKSYESLPTRKIPLLDCRNDQKDKVSYLREVIAGAFSGTTRGNDDPGRIDQIKKDKEWLQAFGEGDLLASQLFIPIRIITVNRDLDGCGISDMLVFPKKDRDAEDWDLIDDSEKPKEFILIVDLGGHFVTAIPI
jgi:hypothetical protein